MSSERLKKSYKRRHRENPLVAVRPPTPPISGGGRTPIQRANDLEPLSPLLLQQSYGLMTPGVPLDPSLMLQNSALASAQIHLGHSPAGRLNSLGTSNLFLPASSLLHPLMLTPSSPIQSLMYPAANLFNPYLFTTQPRIPAFVTAGLPSNYLEALERQAARINQDTLRPRTRRRQSSYVPERISSCPVALSDSNSTNMQHHTECPQQQDYPSVQQDQLQARGYDSGHVVAANSNLEDDDLQLAEHRRENNGDVIPASQQDLQGQVTNQRLEDQNLTQEHRQRSDSVEGGCQDTNSTRHARSLDRTWDAMYERLAAYKRQHGDCLVPTSWKEDPKLGRWVTNQRHRREPLSEERRARLDSLGFVWCVKHQEGWDTMYERLLMYKQRNGNCLVPQKYKQDRRLGEWVQSQRRERCRDGMTLIQRQRRAKLDAIGFEWRPHQLMWDDMWNRLRQYKAEHGDTLVPRYHQPDPKLGRWVDQQRVLHKRGSIEEERKRKLDALGFSWSRA